MLIFKIELDQLYCIAKFSEFKRGKECNYLSNISYIFMLKKDKNLESYLDFLSYKEENIRPL